MIIPASIAAQIAFEFWNATLAGLWCYWSPKCASEFTRKKNDMNKSAKVTPGDGRAAHFLKSCAGFLHSEGGGVITHPPEHLQTLVSFS